MGQRGPKPVPGKLLAMRGSRWATSRPQEPQPVAMIPPCPSTLDRQGKKLWKSLTTALADCGLMTSLDTAALTRYVLLHRRWETLEAFLTEHGETMEVTKRLWIAEHEDSEGNVVRGHHETFVAGRTLRPEVSVWLGLTDRLLKLEQHFGLTPSGRAGIGLSLAIAQKAVPEGQQDPRRFLHL